MRSVRVVVGVGCLAVVVVADRCLGPAVDGRGACVRHAACRAHGVLRAARHGASREVLQAALVRRASALPLVRPRVLPCGVLPPGRLSVTGGRRVGFRRGVVRVRRVQVSREVPRRGLRPVWVCDGPLPLVVIPRERRSVRRRLAAAVRSGLFRLDLEMFDRSGAAERALIALRGDRSEMDVRHPVYEALVT